jgi:hypothetical protein
MNPALVHEIATRWAIYFEHPGEVNAVLLGLYDAHEEVTGLCITGDDVCTCQPLLLERVDQDDQPIYWVHTTTCEVVEDSEAFDAWCRHITELMSGRRGKLVVLVSGQVSKRMVLVRPVADD